MVPDGMSSFVHVFEPRTGGAIRISLTYDALQQAGKTSAHTDTYQGHFLELVPNEKVVQTLAFETADENMQGEMTVTYTLRDADGGTDLDALHEHLPRGLSEADNETGWKMALAKLALLVETH
jgi:uncharacterized protein YndB with AHSA1/START domain